MQTGAGEDFIVILLFGLGRATSGVSLTSFGQGLARRSLFIDAVSLASDSFITSLRRSRRSAPCGGALRLASILLRHPI